MMIDGNPSKVRCINVVGLKRNGMSPRPSPPARGPSADLSRSHDGRACRGDPRVTRPSLRRGARACSSSSKTSISASTAGPGNDGERHEALRVGVVGVGHLGQHHARILSAHAGRRAGGCRRRPNRAGPGRRRQVRHRSPWTTIERCSIWSMPSRSRYPPSCIAKWPALSWRGASPRWSKSPWPPRSPNREQLVEQARAGGAVLQVGHIERFNPALRALEQLADPPQVHQCRTAFHLHVPLD